MIGYTVVYKLIKMNNINYLLGKGYIYLSIAHTHTCTYNY